MTVVDLIGQQRCSRCNTAKPLNEFRMKRDHRIGRTYRSVWCIACMREYGRIYARAKRAGTYQNRYSFTRLAAARKAAVSPTLRDIAWAAGFLEGEGCFPKNGRSGFNVEASQVNKEPLLRLQRLFGGAIVTHRSRNPRHNDAWRWVISGARARGLAYTVYVFLSEKRRAQIRTHLR